MILSDIKIDKEVENRLLNMNSAFGRLWNIKHLNKGAQICLYMSFLPSYMAQDRESLITTYDSISASSSAVSTLSSISTGVTKLSMLKSLNR